jgi:hypothetical protein
MTSGTQKKGTSPIPDFGLSFGAFTLPDLFLPGVEVSTRVATSFRGCGRFAC